ncbi:MAG: CBS domain-containing protein [Nanoarchaeota archaeon]|nr:CBS domain-containing protein [Nanoarchaeota archaeon]MBU1321397.1 CBS domain-containing protein [Nanoarchaeota archaeon]MBU1597815.1 CBS domain-containing protein [Nanoarchaeota archaeon]MBU2441919.1 CBS domain-containing protein [Nanoarchaeota archaeon]
MKTGYKVGDAMTINPITVTADISLKECAEIMDKKHVGSLLVKDDGKISGIITEQDMVRKAMAKLLDPAKTTVKEIMETELMTIAPDKDIFDALTKMRDYNIRHLPVIEKGKFVGFLTIKDILKIQPQLFELIVEKFELKEESRKPVFGGGDDEGVCEICGNYSDDIQEAGNGQKVCSQCIDTI